MNANMSQGRKSKTRDGSREGAEGFPDSSQELLNQTVTTFIAYVKDDITEMKKSMGSLLSENMDLKEQVKNMGKRLNFTENLVSLLQIKSPRNMRKFSIFNADL